MVQRNKVILEGNMGAVEVWSTGVNMAGIVGTTVLSGQEGLTDWAQAIAADLEANGLPSGLNNNLSTSGTVERIVTQYYNTANVLQLQGEAFPIDVSGGGAADQAYQTCICISSYTGIPGGSYRGRNYWPATAASITAAGRLDGSSAPSTMAAAWVDLLQRFGAAAPTVPDMAAHVFSATQDAMTPVISIRAGDVPDTQRRRRDALIENYTTVAYAPL